MRNLGFMVLLLLGACASEPPRPCHCPDPVVIEPVPEVPAKSRRPTAKVVDQSVEHGEKLLVGTVEFVDIQPGGLHLEARIDSGAKTSSLHARRIVRFERDNRRWIQFETYTGRGLETIRLELPWMRDVKIKAEDEGVEERPVVLVDVRLGPRIRRVEMTLTDRGNYEYPVLIGRNFLGDDALIDTGGKYIQGR